VHANEHGVMQVGYLSPESSLSYKQRSRNFFKTISILYTLNRSYNSMMG